MGTSLSEFNIFKSDSTNINQTTQPLESLKRRVPIVTDKVLIDLVNGIQVGRDIIRYRKSRGFIGQLIDSIAGTDNYKRQTLLSGNLVEGQDALRQWVLELSDSLRISQVALEVTQQSLLEARDAIRLQQERLRTQEQSLLELSDSLYHLAQKVGTRLFQLEERVKNLEARVAANEDIERIVTAWEAKQTYVGIPWAFQVILLAREVFSSSVAIYESKTNDKETYRYRLINKILALSSHMPSSFFGLTDLLEQSWSSLDEHDLHLSAALLEVRSPSSFRIHNSPILFMVGSTLEFAALPKNSRPRYPAKCAFGLCRAQISSNISRTIDIRGFVSGVVNEIADDCLTMIARNP